MSDQRKMRGELKQGLHQFMMSLYNSYKQSMNHEGAVEVIGKCLEEEYQYFTKQSIQKEENKEITLTDQIKNVEAKAKKEKDPNKQYELYQDMETLMNAQDILAKY